MGRQTLLLSGILAAGMLAMGVAHADVLYDNGPYDGQTSAPNIVAGNYATDSFTIRRDSTVNGAEFVAWNYAATDTTVSVDWAIFSGAPQPYTARPLIASGTALVANTFLLTNTRGYGVYSDSFSIPSLALASGTYSLALYSAVASNSDDQVYWDTNGGPSTAVIHTNFGPFEGYQSSQSFQVLGSVSGVPEADSWVLMLLGVCAIAGRKMSCIRRGKTNLLGVRQKSWTG